MEDVRVNLAAQRKFYEQELIKMGFFKAEDKRQLYELSLYELKEAYWKLLNQ